MVSIMPGMENFAPERTLTSSGFSPLPSFCPCSCSRCFERLFHLAIHFLRNAAVPHVFAAGFGLNGEARRHGQSGVGHFGKASAFAAEVVLHLAVAIGFAAAEEVNVLWRLLAGYVAISVSGRVLCRHDESFSVSEDSLDSLPSVTISEKSAMVENSFNRVCSSARRFARMRSSRP